VSSLTSRTNQDRPALCHEVLEVGDRLAEVIRRAVTIAPVGAGELRPVCSGSSRSEVRARRTWRANGSRCPELLRRPQRGHATVVASVNERVCDLMGYLRERCEGARDLGQGDALVGVAKGPDRLVKTLPGLGWSRP
jgi:hypothetical protein